MRTAPVVSYTLGLGRSQDRGRDGGRTLELGTRLMMEDETPIPFRATFLSKVDAQFSLNLEKEKKLRI